MIFKRPMSKRVLDIILTIIIIVISICVSLFVEKVLLLWEHVSTVFMFSVFLVSMLTDGYAYGLIATAVGVLCTNFAFTSPYFDFDFSAKESIFSAIFMLVISFMTSTLTTRLKKWQSIKADGEKERMRANLLRAVSHDLRTPLTTIYGSSSAILDNYSVFSDKQKTDMIAGIKEDSEWLIRIVENLLSVTRLDDGRAKILKTPTVLEELIDSVILKFKKRYPYKTVDIEIPEEIVVIPMDPILIEQVIINMLENSVKHAVGMTRITLLVELCGDDAVFSIIDNGCGIEKERITDIFEGKTLFLYGDSNSEKKNSGIGLSVCATIVKAHGGAIYAENRKDGGAQFTFTLKTDKKEHENGAE